MRTMKWMVVRHWAAPLLLLLLAACSGLAGEPEIVATFARSTAPPSEPAFPAQPPDLASGAQIFQANCTRCHGTGGAGDGELVLANEVGSPGDFTQPELARDQTPQMWFETITNGRMAALMPPWRGSLSAPQRWDVALYTYTLHYTPEQIAEGEAVWNDVCTENCDTLPGVGDLSDQEAMVSISDSALGAALPDAVNEDDRWAVVAYLRSRNLTNAGTTGQVVQPPAATEEAQPQAEAPAAGSVAGAVSGAVTNGTAGSEVPEELPVTLYVWDSEFNVTSHETTTGAGSVFTFDDITIDTTHAYAITVDYRDRRFVSDLVRGDPSNPQLELPVTIYELTEDPSVITITGLVNQITALGNSLQVVQVVNFQNTSDRVYTSSSEVNDNQYASLVLNLPPGATVIGFPNNEERFIVSEDQTTVVDTVPVLPGTGHIIQMVYLVPYEGDAIIEYPINYSLEGQVRALLLPDTLEIVNSPLEPIGPQQVGQNTYTGYGAQLALNPDDVVSYEVRGEASTVASEVAAQAPASDGGMDIVMVLALVGVGFIAAGVFVFFMRRRGSDDSSSLIDALVRQIAELDADHEQGRINHDVYQRQRQQLKARLTELLSEDDDSS